MKGKMSKYLILILIIVLNLNFMAKASEREGGVEKIEKNIERKEMKLKVSENMRKDNYEKRSENSTNSKPNEEQKKDKKLQSCDEVKNSMNNRILVMEKSLERRKQSMSNIQSGIEGRLKNLEAAGKDTSSIRLSLSNLNTLSDNFILERQNIISKLKDVANIDCSTNKEALKQSIRNFNTAYKNQNRKSKEITNYLRENIILPIKALEANLAGVTINE